MSNPILNQLNSNLMSNITNVRKLIQGKDPNAMLQIMLSSNPQFKDFYEKNKDKTAEQIAQSYGLDYEQIKALL